MARFKKTNPEKKEGKIIYGESIIDNIVCLTVEEIPFVELFHKVSSKRKNAAVTVYLDKKGVDVDICVKIHFSQRVSEVVFSIQEAVRHNVESMTEYKIQSVNVIVMGVIFVDTPNNPNVNNQQSPAISQAKDSTKEKTQQEKNN